MDGSVFGRYRITQKIGEGGITEVWAATHEAMQREVVIKLLQPEMSAQQDIVKRFFSEAQATACIDHPGIVKVFDVGYARDGRAYISMEKLSGESLEQRLQRQNFLAVQVALRLIRQLAGAVGAAHKRKIIHRDLNPSNVFIVSDPEVPGGERIKVVDFGLAGLIESRSSQLITRGMVLGTPAYMAPEQRCNPAAAQAPSHLYSIGCILYRSLTGRPPYGIGGFDATAEHPSSQLLPPYYLRSDMPREIDELVMSLLAEAPEQRPQTCAEL
ncbi:MAG: serine/threonine-protein kinase, partial [Myxococcota bacterium]